MKKKRVVLLLLWLMLLVAYLDRVNISVAGPSIMSSLHISPLAFGGALSAFTFGYAILQIPGGILADKFGAKPILVVSLIWWTIFTGMTGFVSSLTSLVVIRVLFGVGEGLENGPQMKLLGDLFHGRKRSTANAIFFSAVPLGPALVAPFAAWLLQSWSWREMFFVFTIPGIIMAVLMWWLIPNKIEHKVVDSIQKPKRARVTLADILTHKSALILFVSYFGFNLAFYGLNGWLPSYLAQARHIDLKSLGFYASLPYVTGFFGLLIMGWIGAKLVNYRPIVIAISYVLAGIFLYIAFSAATVGSSLVGLSGAGFFLYAGLASMWTVSLDVFPEELRGTFSGFINFGGQVGGFVAPLSIGAIVTATGSYYGGFMLMIAGLFLAAICFTVIQFMRVRANSINTDPIQNTTGV